MKQADDGGYNSGQGIQRIYIATLPLSCNLTTSVRVPSAEAHFLWMPTRAVPKSEKEEKDQ